MNLLARYKDLLEKPGEIEEKTIEEAEIILSIKSLEQRNLYYGRTLNGCKKNFLY